MNSLLSYCGLVVARNCFWKRFTCTLKTGKPTNLKENPSEVQNDQRKSKSNEPRNKLSTSRIQKKECESCHEMIYVAQFHLHFKSCKIYFMHLKKLPSGFECRLCSHQTTHNEGLALKPRIRMYNHLKDSHSEKFDISNRDELKENKKPERNNKNDQLKAEKMPERKNENDILEDNCQLCNEIISETTLSDHVLSCLFYPEIIKKSASGFGYECIECQFKSEAKSALNVIQNHIKFAHPDKVLTSSKEISSHIFKMAIFPKIFDYFMTHIIR